MKKISKILWVATLLAAATPACAQTRKQLLDAEWKFQKGELTAQAGDANFDDAAWRVVNLPHDWSIEGVPSENEPSGNDGGYRPTGKGWYRKTFEMGKTDELKIGKKEDKRFSLYFEGVYMNAEVFVNGKSLGTHHYGYSSFIHDVTDLLKEGKNTIAVSVDNSQQKNSRWYTGSGIYRHVWLVCTENIHFKHWGTFITTPQVSAQKATVSVATEVTNDSKNPKQVTVEATLADSKGNDVGKSQKTISIGAGETVNVTQLIDIDKPQLWSPETPALYKAHLAISEDGTVKDKMTETFGVRTIEYTAEQGFLLNGKKVELNGGCIHHDNGILGAAAFDRAEVRKVELMKAAGFNAVRTSHNHPSEAFLHACDSIGLLVIDEAFDGWRSPKQPYDYSILIDKHWQEDVAALVLRDRNHPSIFCWSVGNEIIERKEIQVVTTARKLAGLCRQLDPTRPVTSALCAWDSDWEIYDPLAEAFEIVGYNYMIHKHQTDHERDPKRIMMQTESYPREAFKNWAYSNDHDYIIGDFVWTSVDYLGESSIGRWYYEGDSPGEHYSRNQFPWNAAYCGDIDLTGLRKPISYYRDLLWNEDRPLYLSVKEPNGYFGEIRETQWSVWPTSESWTWPGHEGKDIDVEIYSRSPKVRLYLNDRLVAERATTRNEEYKAVIRIKYEPGVLRAEAIDENGQTIEALNSGRNELHTAEEPYAIRLTADRSTIKADGQDLSFVTAEVVDRNGILCPNASVELTFTLNGKATLLAAGNGDIKELDTTADNKHKTWKGRALGVVRSSNRANKSTLTVSAPGLKAAKVAISSK
ncbi:MAG: glycoside hydrolase family 2 TIM barrel-domain containing protein [Bacteroidaceae bacterium]|nr:glycoside hydrolase family 2 TIM barrel-domain containing protein [Bacteroidaceae bacterium]